MKRFADFDWPSIVKMLGGSGYRRLSKDEVQCHLPSAESRPGGVFIFSENGGELNVSEIVPMLPQSVPYVGNRGTVDDFGLASRLNLSLRGEPIDYSDPVFWSLEDP